MSVRVEQIGGATLYLGDCRDVGGLRSPDVVVSDPPYSIPHKFSPQVGAAGNGTRTLSWDWDSDLTPKNIVAIFAPMFVQAHAAFVFCGLRQATLLAEAMADVGLVDKMAAWVKPYPPPPAPGNWWPSGFELAVYGHRPRAFFGDKNPARSNVFSYDSLRHGNSEKNGHPTQKPLALMQKIVRSIARAEDVVMDPFMGSGTTGVAAIGLGRKFVGIEINPEYFDIACKRIEAATRQPNLFIEEFLPPKRQVPLDFDATGGCD